MSENISLPPPLESTMQTNAHQITASRWDRLWASLIDCLTMMIITIPTMYFTGGFDGISKGVQPSIEYRLFMMVLGIIVFLAINANLLSKSGQTVGKKLLKIKIVDLDGNLPTFKQHLIKRYAVYFLPGQIPVIGSLLAMIDILFIFGKEKRCVHDYIAGTKVVEE